ncbi:TAXI family TRAP transporter solute-binding subunit [Devosia elaeis]|nr:TAXI family TRAP transporter solute-binding subunit [Devosia elaeis]
MKLFKSCLVGVAAAALVAGLAVPSVAQEAIRIGTASVGSTFYIVANGLGSLVYKHAGINASVEPVGGSHANIFGLNAGTVDYAITNSGASYEAFSGEPPFEAPANIYLVAQGDVSLRYVLVRRDANITSADALSGHVMVGQRPAMPEIGSISSALIELAGLGSSDVNVVSTAETNEAEQQLRLGTVQAAILPGGPNVPSVVQLFRDGIVDHLYLTEEQVAAMEEVLPPYLFTYELPTGHFEGQEQDATIFGLKTYFVAGPNTSEEQVYQVTKALFDNYDEFAAFHSSAKEWTIENSLSDPIIPFHPGAVRYFQEAGVWTPELEARQAELLASR